ncbi:hypothetical protein OWR29_27500 [Actinoplanes sp. Pm04-4]|uniref:H(+)-exporting diphosphatase n=1 Tax=Paractinoplanes pyxinae TaxID=2997416 RepID=A0ABT4B7C1_9ACTN|nr:hypothetical protein [Actinoplanes pyxinae]MCY1141760.1 hypothetical protein [Actinoplanes pyxinae]
MIAPGNDVLIFLIALGVLMSSAYAFGRIHQWRRRGRERDEAYRIGYDNASRSIIGMMTARPSTGPAGPAVARAGVHRRSAHS